MVVASCTLDTSGQGQGTGSGGAGATGGAGGEGGMSSTGGAGGLGGAGGQGGAAGQGGQGGGPEAVCGNGALEAGETCDDGNADQNDGCSPLCTLETPEDCPGTSVPLSPPGYIVQSTLLGRTHEREPSCGPANKPDLVYAVTPTVGGTLTATFQGANDKSLSIRSECSSAGLLAATEMLCISGVGTLSTSLWVHAGVTYYVIVDGDSPDFTLNLALMPCGDSMVEGLEDCDDPGDPTCIGCVRCDGAGEVLDPATKHCYRRETTNRNARDARVGCFAWGGDLVGISSQAEHDFILQTQGIGLTGDTWTGGRALAGGCAYTWVNGERWRSAWADNEPSNANDQCVQLWQTSGYRLDDRNCNDSIPSLCERVPVGGCGDGIVQPGEVCDDANTVAGDGCSPACRREVDCSGAGSFQDPVTGHCYRYQTTQATWAEAKADCEQMGGYLASIGSVEENTLIEQNINGGVWIGGWQSNLSATMVMWESPALWCQTLWDNNEPNSTTEDCVELRTNGRWNDADCGSDRGYVCEIPP